MESLYVCRFSNGHIKVGRSVDPGRRVQEHVERVSCLGVTLSRCDSYNAKNAVRAEADLIGRCAAVAHQRHANEWFSGLDFDVVSTWASEVAEADYSKQDRSGHLREYLAKPESMTVAKLRAAMNALGCDIRDDAQIRQWIAVDAEGNFKRQPGAAFAMCLERVTDGAVTRKAMRPNDAHLIWPELA